MRVALHDFNVPKDVIVVTPEEVARQRNIVGTLVRPAVREGKVLVCSRSMTRSPTSFGSGCRKPKTISRLPPTRLKLGAAGPTDTVCFHAQQCVEKYLKALLVLHGIEFERVHQISALICTAARAASP